jgi:hypothetical protein
MSKEGFKMCTCDFTQPRYWDSIIILHNTGSGTFIMLSENTFVVERAPDRIVLGNVRHKEVCCFDIESDDKTMSDPPPEEGAVARLRLLPVVSYLLDNPSEVALIKYTEDAQDEEAMFIGFPKETLHVL